VDVITSGEVNVNDRHQSLSESCTKCSCYVWQSMTKKLTFLRD